MKYWKEGFYLEQDKDNSRYEITDEYWYKLLEGQNQGKCIQTDATGKPYLSDIVYTQEDLIIIDIKNTKKQLEKYKEDVEQVELFGMTRDDYSEKKSKCMEMIIKLRELEKQLKSV